MNENLRINVAEIFGENVFNDSVMQARLPKKVYGKLHQIIAEGGELDIETASGDIDFYGELNKLEFDAASAKFTGVLTNTPKSILVDSMSGDLDVTLPADSGFTVTMAAISGDFTSDFSTTVSNGAYVCGNGTCQIQYNGMYGDIIIRKGE